MNIGASIQLFGNAKRWQTITSEDQDSKAVEQERELDTTEDIQSVDEAGDEESELETEEESEDHESEEIEEREEEKES